MSTAKNSVIALLALTTIAGAALSWRQYKELLDLRASASDRADLQKRIWDLQKENRELSDQLAAARSSQPEAGDEGMAAAAPVNPANEGPRARRGFAGRAQQFAAIREAMQKPEVQALLSSAQKSLIASRYAPLFRTLNLSADQQDKLAALLAERQNTFRDVAQAARDEGVNPRTDPDGFQKLLQDARTSIDDSIKSVIGDGGYSQLTNYDQTMPQRNLVNILQQRLAYSDAPLTSAQSDQLVQILASNAPGGANPGNGNGEWGGRGMGNPAGAFGLGGGRMMLAVGGGAGALTSAPITAQAVSQASSVLNPGQLTALQQLQQQQQTAQELQQIVRNTWQQANAAAGAGNAAPPSSGGATPPAGGRRGPG